MNNVHMLWIGMLHNINGKTSLGLKIAISAILLLVMSCRKLDNFGFYQPITMSVTVPDGPPEYKAGWYSGCKSGMAARHSGAFANATVYQEGKGPEFASGVYMHDSAYQTGWGQGWFSCSIHGNLFTGLHSTMTYPLQ